MNPKARIKLGIFVIGLVSLIPLFLVGLSLLMQFIVAFQQGADPASIFRGHQLVMLSPEQAKWLPLTDSFEGLLPTRPQQEEIMSAYWSAWDAVGRASVTADTRDLATYWSGSAYQQALDSLLTTSETTYTHMGHQLELQFFSVDGSVVTFLDRDWVWTQTVNKVTYTLTVSAEVTMTLDQGFWRIRQLTLYLG